MSPVCRDYLEILGGKWKLMILRYLNNRQHQDIHFKKLEREIDGISSKMLRKQLKELETNLLITRNVADENRVMVFYAIIEYGKSVTPLTENLAEWGIKYTEKLLKDD